MKFWNKTRKTLRDIGLGNDTFDMTPEAKHQQTGPQQIQKLVHSKGNNQQDKKATYRIQKKKKILANYIADKELIYKIHKKLSIFNNKKKSETKTK